MRWCECKHFPALASVCSIFGVFSQAHFMGVTYLVRSSI